jgi:hypothetical protein
VATLVLDAEWFPKRRRASPPLVTDRAA